MRVIYENRRCVNPKVSIVLLDWAVRESYHSLDYLSDQTVPRHQYEIIWIEYYNTRPQEIDFVLKKCKELGIPPTIDKWVIMDMPKSVYYHKHLMYNIGFVLGSGEVMVFCDSDATFRPTFVETIIKEFARDSNIVLHLDEFRNNSKRFHPFNYPSFEEISGEGCINNVGGKTRGVVDKSDPLHLPNYGACMCALREDLITIGGADEHIDYLGHICGPYDMTFRLININKREIWHEDEFLYHVWHPGQAGGNNYFGPHDGKHMSTTALEVRQTGRILPLVENPAVRALRRRQTADRSRLISMLIPDGRVNDWSVRGKKWYAQKYDIGNMVITVKELKGSGEGHSEGVESDTTNTVHSSFWVTLRLNEILFRMCIKAMWKKFLDVFTFPPSSAPSLNIFKWLEWAFVLPSKVVEYIEQTVQYNRYVIRQCRRCLDRLASEGEKDADIFEINDVTELLCVLNKLGPVKISAVYDTVQQEGGFYGLPVLPLASLNGGSKKVIVSSLLYTDEKIEMLERMGVKQERIVRVI
ncbi:MAG: glycosyltransferase family A protein [Candidatus Brocadiales bacterium]|nr:glycosyltransferase family A protein [Candidatus Brocadiales bacterium]